MNNDEAKRLWIGVDDGESMDEIDGDWQFGIDEIRGKRHAIPGPGNKKDYQEVGKRSWRATLKCPTWPQALPDPITFGAKFVRFEYAPEGCVSGRRRIQGKAMLDPGSQVGPRARIALSGAEPLYEDEYS